MENNSNYTSGLSFSSVLFLVFLVLKLTNVIDWSWWWVLSPLWITFMLCMLIFILMVIVIDIMKK